MKRKKISTVTAHVMHFLNKSQRDNIPALAGQSAFYLILSAVPMLLFVFSLFSLLTGKDIEVSDFPSFAGQDLFPHVDSLLNYIVDSVHKATSGTAIITAVVMLWSAGRGMYCITDGILRVYRIPNNKPWIFKRVYAMGYTIVTLLLMMVGLLFVMFNIFFVSAVNTLTGNEIHVSIMTRIALYAGFMLLQSLLLTVALKLFLRGKLKNPAYRTMRALYPGMLMTVIAWNGLTFGVVFYIRHFAVSSVYGSLASLFVAMMWVCFMMYILLYGIQLNYIYRRRFSSLRLFKHRQKEVRSSTDNTTNE